MKKRFLLVFIILASLIFSNYNSVYVSADQNDTLGLMTEQYYYIRNLSNGKYLDVFNAEDKDGTGVWTYQSNRSYAQLWKITRVGTNKYRIQSICSSSGRSLTTNSSGWSFIQTYTGSTYQQFTIERHEQKSNTADGTYTIKYQNKYLAVDSGGSYLEWTTVNSNKSKWTFEKAFPGYAYGYAMKSDIDTTNGTTYFLNALNAIGYAPVMGTNSTNFSNAYTNFTYSDIFLNYQHGSAATSGFYTVHPSNPKQNQLVGLWVSEPGYRFGTQNTIISYPNNALATNRCVLWWSCEAGLDYVNGSLRYSLVDKTFERGAHFVIAPKFTFTVTSGNNWLNYFSARLYNGYSIYDAIDYANLYTPVFSGKLYFRGDGHQHVYVN